MALFLFLSIFIAEGRELTEKAFIGAVNNNKKSCFFHR